MWTVLACLTGFILDFIFGDPVWLYHPVRLMGACITALEKAVRKICGESPGKLLIGGGILWCIVLVAFTMIPALLLRLVKKVYPFPAFILETFWCYQILAAKSLRTESMKVYRQLERGNLAGARQAVSMIVGRDTDRLDAEGVAKAAVETVAENTSDGVTAPLFYMMIGGAPLGFAYKAVNTMDSMLGYKEETYLYIGRMAAKMDDVVNYIPARLSAFLMLAASWILRMDWKNAWHIFRRDRYKHSSPNSAQTESVCAGALDVRLAGDAWYFGKRYQKEYIGDPLRPVEAEDIRRANRLMYVTSVLALVLFSLARVIFLRIVT
jgi:adenosylcobinamide-phosphate synthase